MAKSRHLLSLVVLALLLFPLFGNPSASAASCTFVLGFQAIHDQIPDIVGGCLVDQHYNPANGDALQETTGGMLVWRKADNFTAFTDGYHSWVNGPYGLQQRLNTERFDWENDVGPAAPSQPVAAAPAQPTVASFGQGQKIVGTDIAPGTYRTRTASPGCYYARLSGFGGTLGEIIANENANGPAVVTIAKTDRGFESNRCGTWTADLSAITQSPTAPLAGDGIYIVGTDIAPGLWRADGVSSCYWARLSGFGGSLDEIIANDNAKGTAMVQIGPSDKGFETSRCGTWSKVQ